MIIRRQGTPETKSGVLINTASNSSQLLKIYWRQMQQL